MKPAIHKKYHSLRSRYFLVGIISVVHGSSVWQVRWTHYKSLMIFFVSCRERGTIPTIQWIVIFIIYDITNRCNVSFRVKVQCSLWSFVSVNHIQCTCSSNTILSSWLSCSGSVLSFFAILFQFEWTKLKIQYTSKSYYYSAFNPLNENSKLNKTFWQTNTITINKNLNIILDK